jgi:heme exporter protein C
MNRDKLYLAFMGLALLLSLATLFWTFEMAPDEALMGFVQKIFYFHVPSAISMQLLFVTSGIASIVYLVRGSEAADRLACCSAEVGVMMAAFVLITGPLWARIAWGHYWEWEPRLTLTMVLLFMFVAYVALRAFGGDDPLTPRICAGLAIAGLPAIYLVRIAVEKWRGTHPQVVWKGGLNNPDMVIAFALGCFAFICISVTLVWSRYTQAKIAARIDEITLELMERDLLEDEL